MAPSAVLLALKVMPCFGKCFTSATRRSCEGAATVASGAAIAAVQAASVSDGAAAATRRSPSDVAAASTSAMATATSRLKLDLTCVEFMGLLSDEFVLPVATR